MLYYDLIMVYYLHEQHNEKMIENVLVFIDWAIQYIKYESFVKFTKFGILYIAMQRLRTHF